MEGFVPSTYMKTMDDKDSESQSSDVNSQSEESYSESEEESEQSSASQEESEEDEGMLMSEQADEPDTEVQDVLQALKRRKSRKSKAAEGTKLIAPDALEGFSDLPTGYRRSTLAKNYNCGIGRTSDWLVPELSSSGIGLKDLFIDRKGKIRKRVSACTIAFSVLEARSIATPPAGLKVLGRHVRMALFDRANIKSNIVLQVNQAPHSGYTGAQFKRMEVFLQSQLALPQGWYLTLYVR
jgi:hypothetical protein